MATAIGAGIRVHVQDCWCCARGGCCHGDSDYKPAFPPRQFLQAHGEAAEDSYGLEGIS